MLDSGCHNPRDTYSVAPHTHGNRFAILVEDFGAHGFGILGAELENVADFDTALNFNLPLATRTGVTCGDGSQVGDFKCGDIPVPVHTSQVLVVFIGAADEVAEY